MFLQELSKIQIAVLILIAFAASLAALTTAPFIRIAVLDKQMTQKHAELVSTRGALLDAKDETAKFSQLTTESRNANILLTGSTTGIAGANLQKIVTNIVRRNQGRASTIQTQLPEKTGALTQITVSLKVQISNEGLRKLLFDLETRKPFIFVDSIKVQPELGGLQKAAVNKPVPLNVTMTVSGFLATPEGSSGT